MTKYNWIIEAEVFGRINSASVFGQPDLKSAVAEFLKMFPHYKGLPISGWKV